MDVMGSQTPGRRSSMTTGRRKLEAGRRAGGEVLSASTELGVAVKSKGIW